ncbi:MAG: hypothetical protein OGM16_16210 [Lachnospiraceae bacterium]|nr:MAG: hypothetical protein OGM16_16210 [Lachnospiraceae bacterium]
MNITDIVLTQEQITNAVDGIMQAVDITDGYDYVGGKRAESPSFKKVTMVLPKRKFERVVVKVYDMKIPLSSEMIEQKGGSIKVRAKALAGRFYFDRESREYKLSCKAEGLEVLP